MSNRTIADFTVDECERAIGQLMRQITRRNPNRTLEIQSLNMLDMVTRFHAS